MSNLANLNPAVSLHSGAQDFSTVYLARAVGRREGAGSGLRWARNRGASPRALEMIEKAATSVGSLTGFGAELALLEPASQAFLATLVPFSAFDFLTIGQHATVPLPMYSRLAAAQSAAVASLVGENAAKPMTRFTISSEVMPQIKVVAFLAYTKELLITNSARVTQLFETMLRNAIAVETDTKALQVISAGTGVPSYPNTGDLVHDINTALRGMDLGVGSKLFCIMPKKEYFTAKLVRDAGGYIVSPDDMIGGVRIIPTSASVTDSFLVDASSIGADPGIVIPDGSSQADIIADDNPIGSTHTLYTWQGNMLLSRIERWFGCAVLRSTGIAILQGENPTA